MIGLTALGNMLLELYADCAGYPVNSVIRDAAGCSCTTIPPASAYQPKVESHLVVSP